VQIKNLDRNKMKKIIRSILHSDFGFFIRAIIANSEYKKWIKTGGVHSPHVVKQLAIKEYQKKFNLKLLVETGTYLGDMVFIQRSVFENIISIELSEFLYLKACKRFRNNKNIKILQGDSGVVLNKVIQEINTPALFWLDGHYSSGVTAKGDKECPIFEELNAIFKGNELPHILLIDDARCFVGLGDYPTIEELKTHILKNRNSNFDFEVKDDIIRVALK